jgi:hypothetical protein
MNNPRNVEYNLSNSKPLINREQNYVLDRKLLTVHSEDRDITKWPNSNTFEIMLPEQLLNVQSMRLIQSTFPGSFFIFSEEYQNTKMQFTIYNTLYQITIQAGTYTPGQLTLELTNKMNAMIPVSQQSFNVFYDEVGRVFWFGHTDASFNLNFDQKIDYITVCDQPTVWNNYAKWGLPYYLGFNKEIYYSKTDLSGVSFDYICPCNSTVDNADLIKHYISAPMAFNLIGETCIYMEIDKYNSYDEIYPYNQSSRQMFDNNAYSGKVNTAFAKIPIHSDYNFDSRTFYLHNTVHYDPPIERIARLKIKFRFHDGRLVDFQNFPFDFTIEFNTLRNEIEKKYNVRLPAAYKL